MIQIFRNMEEIFSSTNVIEKKLAIVVDNLSSLKLAEDFDFYFDIENIVSWIQTNNYKKVSYQSEFLKFN